MYREGVVNNLLVGIQAFKTVCGILNAGGMPLQMPSDGAFSIFYRGCKQSNLSTHTAFVGFSSAKVIVFVQTLSIAALFLLNFNFL